MQVEEARAYSNLGSSYHYRRNFTQAIAYHEHVLRIAQELGDRAIEARAYAGLGHAARCAGDCNQVRYENFVLYPFLDHTIVWKLESHSEFLFVVAGEKVARKAVGHGA